MYRLIQEYKAQADVVIFDSPPLLYSDALVLAPQVDGVLLAVNSGITGRENTINAVESLRLVGAHLIGTVLNRVKAGPAYSYYPASVSKRSLTQLATSAAPPALQGPGVVQDAPARVERALVDGDGQQEASHVGDTTPYMPTVPEDANAAPMARQSEPIAASAPAEEISAEVGGPSAGYEAGAVRSEPEVEAIEADTAHTNGYREEHGRHGRRNRNRS
jgi:hypothetical protein